MMNIVSYLKGVMGINDSKENTLQQSMKVLSAEQADALRVFGVEADAGTYIGKYGFTDPLTNITDILVEIVEKDLLNEAQILQFDEKVLSTKYIKRPELTPGGADIALVVEAFCKNKHYMNVLKSNNKIHSPEKVRMMAILERCESGMDKFQDAVAAVSSSFEMISQNEEDTKYINLVWVKYLNVICEYLDTVPVSLLSSIDEMNYRQRFDMLKKLVAKAGNNQAAQMHKAHMAMQICNWILENIDKNDAPSLLLLGKLYQEDKNYEQAHKCFERIIEEGDSAYNGISALSDCYEKEIQAIRAKGFSYMNYEGSDVIRDINRKLMRLYEENLISMANQIDACETGEDDSIIYNLETNYTSLACRYARWLKNNGKFMSANAVLNGIPLDYPEYHRVLLEKGLLYQFKGRKYNPYRNLNKALDYFKAAEEMIGDEFLSKKAEKTAYKSVLIPLANVLYELGRYDEVTEACRKVLYIDANEKNAEKLIKRVQSSRNLMSA